MKLKNRIEKQLNVKINALSILDSIVGVAIELESKKHSNKVKKLLTSAKMVVFTSKIDDVYVVAGYLPEYQLPQPQYKPKQGLMRLGV